MCARACVSVIDSGLADHRGNPVSPRRHRESSVTSAQHRTARARAASAREAASCALGAGGRERPRAGRAHQPPWGRASTGQLGAGKGQPLLSFRTRLWEDVREGPRPARGPARSGALAQKHRRALPRAARPACWVRCQPAWRREERVHTASSLLIQRQPHNPVFNWMTVVAEGKGSWMTFFLLP